MPGFKRPLRWNKESTKPESKGDDDPVLKLNKNDSKTKSSKKLFKNVLNKTKALRKKDSTNQNSETEIGLDETDHDKHAFEVFTGEAPRHSQFADFIFEGDDSDIEADLAETEYWAGCCQGS